MNEVVKRGRGAPIGNKNRQGIVEKLRSELNSKLKEMKCEPVIGMAEIAIQCRDRSSPDFNLPLAVMCYKEIAKYVHPQLKAVDHTGDQQQKLTIIINDSGSPLLDRNQNYIEHEEIQ